MRVIITRGLRRLKLRALSPLRQQISSGIVHCILPIIHLLLEFDAVQSWMLSGLLGLEDIYFMPIMMISR